VLSDEAKRAAYDEQLKHRFSARTNDARESNRAVSRQPVFRSRAAVKERKYYWVWWLLIIVTILSSMWVLSNLKKKRSSEVELSEIRLSISGGQLTHDQMLAKLTRREEILVAHPELIGGERMREDAARTIPIFLTDIEVNLSGVNGRALRIPVLGAKVGSFDADKIKLYLSSNRELIRHNIEAKLAAAKYEDLVKADGEAYLQTIILDAIGETSGTDRFKDYPASLSENPGRYGAVEAYLPKSFSVTAAARQ
jgi:hypothetical protein